jgi:hypothetical protein
MGMCSSHDENALGNHQGQKEEVLISIRNNLSKLEENIIKLRKEDVHYRMTRLMFLLNTLKDITPFIRVIEDSSSTLNLALVKDLFDEVFMSLWRNDRDNYEATFFQLRDCIEGKTPLVTEGNSDKSGNYKFQSKYSDKNNHKA